MYKRYIYGAYLALALWLWPTVTLCQALTPNGPPFTSLNNRAALQQPIGIRADSTRGDSIVPRAALLRSALLPGWGQLYNDKPYKAVFFATVSAGLLGTVVGEQIALSDAQTPLESENRAARRNTRILFLALSFTFAALDAYIDAHLANFSTEMHADGALLTLHVDLPP